MKLSGFGSVSYVRFFWFCCPVGLWATRAASSTFPQARRRTDLSGAFFVLAGLEGAIGVVAANASWSVEDGVRAVGIDADLGPRPDEVRAHRALRDLQFQRLVGDAIVVADLPLLFDAQDLVEIDAGDRRERRAFAGRLNPEAGIMGRQIDLAQERVGRLDRRDPGELELLDQALPGSRFPRASASATGLRPHHRNAATLKRQ